MNRTHPKRIGPYRILELLGEGAWGLVYLADQTEGVRRRVAIKVLKRGVDTDEVLARFDAERQAMALMSHPNIAQILDAGATDQGLSYFVMEYIEGEPITKYCDSHKLSVAERVELLQQVCWAIQHAHQKGIIHRDLKPNNVLVARVEGSAVPKVIDFGIAKAMHQRLTDKTLYTTQGQFIGTPGYMSPEQALQGSLEVDTTTDIYALGVILYELMTGVLPLELRLLDMDSMFKMLRDTDPSPMSARLTQLGDKAKLIAAARSVDVKTLTKKLSGDLTWVVARAIEKDRTRRYQASSELAAELGRYLRNEAVLAGPPGAGYQLKKFVGRNKGPVASAAMLIVLLTGFSGVLAVQLQRVAAEAERANRGEATAQQVSDFLVGLFEVSDPSESLGNTITAREILDVGAERIETELADQPIVKAQLMHTMGGVYRSLGLDDRAGSLLEQAIALRERHLGERHPDLANSLDDLGEAYWRLARYEEAETVLRRSLAIREEAQGVEHVDVAATLNHLGNTLSQQGRFADADAVYRRGVSIREAALGPEHDRVARDLSDLAINSWGAGNLSEAESLFVRVLAIREGALDPNHPGLAWSISVVGSLRVELGKYAEAEAILVRALALAEGSLGPNHQELTWYLRDLGRARQGLAKYAEAETLLVRGLANAERSFGPDHPNVATLLGSLGGLAWNTGRYAEAEPLWVRALAIFRETLGSDHPNVAFALTGLADVLAKLDRYAEAEPLYTQAMEIREQRLVPDHPDVASSLHGLANLYRDTNRLSEAEPLYQRAVAIGEKLRPEHPDVARMLNDLAKLYTLQGRADEAEDAYRRALSIREAELGVDHPDVAETLEDYAALIRQMGREEEAESMEERTRTIRAIGSSD